MRQRHNFKFNIIYILTILIFFSFGFVFHALAADEKTSSVGNTQLKKHDFHSKSHLLISTLDGSLIGIEPLTGNIAWTVHDEPIVKVPINPEQSITPHLLPDPKDGSLYLFADQRNSLKKLPFSIQQLVASSPCRSTDGIMYTGRKIDSWYLLNYATGEKQPIVTFNQSDPTCPISISDVQTVYLGRTEYDLIMHDMKDSKRQWNVTFMDYAAIPLTQEQRDNYNLLHYADTSNGNFATVDSSGDTLWTKNFGSPVVAVYTYDNEDLIALPFTSVAEEAFNNLMISNKQNKMLPTLYVGEHHHGMYAIPSLAAPSDSPLMLLDDSEIIPPKSLPGLEDHSTKDEPDLKLIPGYYHMPEYSNTRLQITGRTDPVIQLPRNNATRSNSTLKPHSTPISMTDQGLMPNDDGQQVNFIVWTLRYVVGAENLELKVIMACLVITMSFMFGYIMYQVRELKRESQSSSSSQSSTGSNLNVTAISEELSDGKVRVGKITFDSTDVLGKGCEGTFVFRGEFDNRSVAVKRLLPECFTFADREVCLLRESDQHANVVRYFCTEQDKQFRYIALQLCATTLQEYTEKGTLRHHISNIEVLHQATKGLEYLHSLDIVHRDIKPHNVLLSIPDSDGRVRAMISDFGLCKKLQKGKVSFSKRSGITGTDGWIAPEIMKDTGRAMCNVDIFSLGCVYYYVLSNGKHPFGDTLRRQFNILKNQYSLNHLDHLGYNQSLWKDLLKSMLHLEPLQRPTAKIIAKHPVFWDNSNILNFLQDVSDRIEKEDLTDPVVLNLEIGADCVTQGNWRELIDADVADDLRKYRNYRGESLRDLLRALRNKKHHYRELTESAQMLLGTIPNEFMHYWLSRFPNILNHTWISMQCIRSEHSLSKYYVDSNYEFNKSGNTSIPKWIEHYKENKKSNQFTTDNNNQMNISPTTNNKNNKNNKYSYWKNKKQKAQLLQNGSFDKANSSFDEIMRVDDVRSDTDIYNSHNGIVNTLTENSNIKTNNRHRTTDKNKKRSNADEDNNWRNRDGQNENILIQEHLVTR